jgi:TolA-binding protein
MKRFIYVIVSVVLSVSSINAQDYKQAFATIQQEFEQRLSSTENTIKEYLEKYPYTTYEDELKTMQGVLYTEKEKYKNAVKVFNKVKVTSTRIFYPRKSIYRALRIENFIISGR